MFQLYFDNLVNSLFYGLYLFYGFYVMEALVSRVKITLKIFVILLKVFTWMKRGDSAWIFQLHLFLYCGILCYVRNNIIG
jgi:hypothetical protein